MKTQNTPSHLTHFTKILFQALHYINGTADHTKPWRGHDGCAVIAHQVGGSNNVRDTLTKALSKEEEGPFQQQPAHILDTCRQQSKVRMQLSVTFIRSRP